MTGFKLDARARLSIELALTANGGERHSTQRQDTDARALGMTGAEIDMARRGTSFDFQLSKAIALALAPNDERRACAMQAGIDAQICADIEKMAATYLNGTGVKSA